MSWVVHWVSYRLSLPICPISEQQKLPSSFLAAYISFQIGVLFGARPRQVVLEWDKGYAWRGMCLWFLVCIMYTIFVYLARLLLTLLMVFAGPRNMCFEEDCYD
jgi:hypothetical protein